MDDSFLTKRINFIKEQATFGTPDIKELKPILEDIINQNYTELKIEYKSKEGNLVCFKSKDRK